MASVQKEKLLFLMNYMLKNTDEKHGLSRTEIEQLLEENGFSCGRKSIYDDFEAMSNFGIDIETTRSETVRYYVAKRDFQLAEVKLLVDAVVYSRFLTHSKTEALVQKLSSLVSTYQAESLNRQVFFDSRNKSINETVYHTIDVIHNAINDDKAISVKYFKWCVGFSGESKFIRCYRNGGNSYTVSPWGVCWSNGNYYLIGYDHDDKIVKNFRVDRINHIVSLKTERIKNEEFKSFKIEEYTERTFGMYGGEETYVRLCVPNGLANVIVDYFGNNITVTYNDKDSFIAGVRVVVSKQFFGWLLGLSENVRIISPQNVVKEMKTFVNNAYMLYKDS